MKTKRTLMCVLFVLLMIGSVFALDNSLEKYLTAEPYETLLATIKDGRLAPSKVKEAYEDYKKVVPSGYGAARGCYIYGIFLTEIKDKAGYKVILEELKELGKTVTDEFEADTFKIDVLCLIGAEERTLSAGLKLTDGLKDYYEKWSSKELYAVLTEAWRYINTPNFAGGSSKKALEVFETLLPYENSLPTEFRFSLYKGFLTAHYDKKDWKDANFYCQKANGIFPYEPELMDFTEKLKKKVK